MVKPNAAKHLLFAVSFLLLFFVFMGYRMRGSSRTADAGTAEADGSALVSGLRPVAAESAVSSAGMARAESAPPSGVLRPDPSAVMPLDDEEEVEDLAGWVPSESSGGGGMPLSLPVPGGSLVRPSGGDAGAIAGLVPDAIRPGGLSLPLPSDDDDPFEDDEEETDVASLPASLIRPGGALKPPESESVPPAFLPPPPFGGGAASSAPMTDDDGEEDAPFLPLPGAGSGAGNRNDGEFRPSSSPASPAPEPRGAVETAAGASRPLPSAGQNRPVREEPASSVPPVRPAATDEWEPGADLRVYVIRPGDTLSNIAARELGSASLADNIFLFNRDVIIDPDHLMVGQKIRLPARDGAGGYGGLSAAPDPVGGRRPTQGLGRVHRVARGDTLSSIALQYYGTATGWRFLYESNKNVVPDPNRLSVGTELTIPPYEQ